MPRAMLKTVVRPVPTDRQVYREFKRIITGLKGDRELYFATNTLVDTYSRNIVEYVQRKIRDDGQKTNNADLSYVSGMISGLMSKKYHWR